MTRDMMIAILALGTMTASIANIVHIVWGH
jgi:hypothetical protein